MQRKNANSTKTKQQDNLQTKQQKRHSFECLFYLINCPADKDWHYVSWIGFAVKWMLHIRELSYGHELMLCIVNWHFVSWILATLRCGWKYMLRKLIQNVTMQALTLSKNVTRATGWRESECQAPDYSTPVAGIHSKPPSDKWHNERTVPNVRAPSVSPLREQMRGNTWGRGGYSLDMFALTQLLIRDVKA